MEKTRSFVMEQLAIIDAKKREEEAAAAAAKAASKKGGKKRPGSGKPPAN